MNRKQRIRNIGNAFALMILCALLHDRDPTNWIWSVGIVLHGIIAGLDIVFWIAKLD